MASAERTDVMPTGTPATVLRMAGFAMSALPFTTSVANVVFVADDVTVATPVVRSGLVGTVTMLADCAAPDRGRVTVGVGGTRLVPANDRLRPKAEPETASGPLAALAAPDPKKVTEAIVAPRTTIAALAIRGISSRRFVVANGSGWCIFI